MSLLTVIQGAITESGFGSAPVSVIGNTDALAVQCLALANRAGKVIATAHNWQNLIRPYTLTTVAGQEVYDGPNTNQSTSVARFIGDTMWDSTNFLPVGGAITPQEWMTLKYGVGGTLSLSTRKFKVALDSSVNGYDAAVPMKIHLYPTPTTNGEVLVAEYVSSGWAIHPDVSYIGLGLAGSDNCMFAFPEHLLEQSLIWRLRRAKGFDYTEEYNEYKEQLALAIARDTPAPMLNFSYMPAVAWPVNIPQTIPVP